VSSISDGSWSGKVTKYSGKDADAFIAKCPILEGLRVQVVVWCDMVSLCFYWWQIDRDDLNMTPTTQSQASKFTVEAMQDVCDIECLSSNSSPHPHCVWELCFVELKSSKHSHNHISDTLKRSLKEDLIMFHLSSIKWQWLKVDDRVPQPLHPQFQHSFRILWNI
jgi:hypothetical protein